MIFSKRESEPSIPGGPDSGRRAGWAGVPVLGQPVISRCCGCLAQGASSPEDGARPWMSGAQGTPEKPVLGVIPGQVTVGGGGHSQ